MLGVMTWNQKESTDVIFGKEISLITILKEMDSKALLLRKLTNLMDMIFMMLQAMFGNGLQIGLALISMCRQFLLKVLGTLLGQSLDMRE